MAGRRAADTSVKKAKWSGFLDFRLSDDQLADLDDWQPSVAEIWEKVDSVLHDGYKVTLSYNAKYHTATATLIDESLSRRSGGYGLSSSDSDGALALKAAMFKHFVVLQGTWESLLDQPLVAGRRG